MKILYCIPHLYNSGGMERVLTQKVNWLITHTTHEIIIVTTELTPKGLSDTYFPLDKRVRVEAMHIDFDTDYRQQLFAKWRGHMRKMRQYRQMLEAFIQKQHIDLCISLCGKEIAFLRQLPCRTIVEMHFAMNQRQQLIEANHRGLFWSLIGRIRTRQLVHAVKPLEHVFVLTKEDQRDWQQAGCKHVTVIPNPCSLDGQPIPPASKSSKTVLAVGRLHEQKGFDLLLHAWKAIESHHPQWELCIVGSGDQRSSLEVLIAELGLQQVVLAGRTKAIEEEYAKASLFVLSSRYEGLPLALIEAMWSGLPCVAFNCPQGPAELLADERGWLVPNGDISALANQIEHVITHTDEAALRAKKAQTYAQTTYSEEAIMPQWLKVINGK